MPITFLSRVSVDGTLTVSTIANETSAAGKFLVPDSNGQIKYRTASEVRSDIGAGTGDGTVTGSGTATRVAVWNGNTDLTSSIRLVFGTNTTFFNNTTSTPIQMQNDGGVGTVKFEGSATSNSSTLQITPGVESKPGLNFGMRSGTGSNDTNTGIFSSAADNLEISTGGSERVNFSSSGTKLTTLNALTSAASTFLISDGNVVKTRTASQVRSDIGAGTGSGTVTGTGSSNRLAIWNTSSALTFDSALIWDDATDKLTSTRFQTATGGAYLWTDSSGSSRTLIEGDSSDNITISHPAIAGTTSVTTVNFGESLIINGGAEEMKVTDSTITLGISTDPTLYVDTTNKKVGFRTTSPGSAFDVNGTTRVRNQLNVGHTTEQNLYVDGNGSAGGKYVKMGNYGQGNYFGIQTNINQPKYVAAFGSAGKVVEERRIVTILLKGDAFKDLSTKGTTLLAAPGSNSIILPFEILIYKSTGTTGTGWPSSNPSFGAEIGFCQGNSLNCSLTNAFDAVWRLPRTLVTQTGTWFWSRSSATLNEVGPNTFQLNKPLILRSATNLTALPTASWYVQIRYAQLNYLSGLVNNVDITKTTNG